MSEPKVESWIKTIESSGCTVESITPLSIQEKSNGELLFAYLNADVTSPEGYKLLPIIHLRGNAVLVVPEIANLKTGIKKFLMVKQRRIANGKINLEFPAGMLDRDIKNPALVAVKELFEETGLSITEDQLFPLSDKLLYSTPGACDEGILFFGAKIEISDNEFSSLDGRLRINESENERIDVVLKSEDEFLMENESIQALLGYNLFKSVNSNG
jgi:ADP-sugar diphosphatase